MEYCSGVYFNDDENDWKVEMKCKFMKTSHNIEHRSPAQRDTEYKCDNCLHDQAKVHKKHKKLIENEVFEGARELVEHIVNINQI